MAPDGEHKEKTMSTKNMRSRISSKAVQTIRPEGLYRWDEFADRIPFSRETWRQRILKGQAPGGKNRHFDGGGLYLEVLASGSKRWRLKYRRPISRKENTLTFGPYPQITLAAARALREKAKE